MVPTIPKPKATRRVYWDHLATTGHLPQDIPQAVGWGSLPPTNNAQNPCRTGLWEMTTSVVQHKGLLKDLEGQITLCHKSGHKPLDPTTLPL